MKIASIVHYSIQRRLAYMKTEILFFIPRVCFSNNMYFIYSFAIFIECGHILNLTNELN